MVKVLCPALNHCIAARLWRGHMVSQFGGQADHAQP